MSTADDALRRVQTAGWDNVDQVAWYLNRIGSLPPRVAGEEVLRSILPPFPHSVLDLGCGDGRLGALALEARPSIGRLVALDRSAHMLDQARSRFAGDPRVTVERWDLDGPIPSAERFDVVVAGFAIHHVEDERKRSLSAEIADHLAAGGLFATLEVVASATPALHAEFLSLIGRVADDPEDRLCDIESQLGWMREAGLVDVDCLWRWRGFALLVGRSPAH